MPKAKRESIEEATDRMFKDEDSWPSWPLLPIKHKSERDSGGFPLLGLLLAKDQQTIYLTNLYLIAEGADLDTVEKLTFTNREAMILSGWRVD